MKIGCPPTPPKARAGLLTPPGMSRHASAKAAALLVCCMAVPGNVATPISYEFVAASFQLAGSVRVGKLKTCRHGTIRFRFVAGRQTKSSAVIQCKQWGYADSFIALLPHPRR